VRIYLIVAFGLCFGSVAYANYPISALSRPLTTPSGVFETSLSFNNLRFGEIRIDYGVTENFQVGVDWAGLSSRGLTPSAEFNIHAAHTLFETPYLRTKAFAGLPIFLQKTVLQETTFSLPTFVTVVPDHLSVVVLEDLVTFNWISETNAQFRFPVRLFWQSTQALSLNVIADLATLNSHPDRRDYSDTHILEMTPVRVQALYGITQDVDVYGGVGFDNVQNGTGMAANLGVVVRTGVS
jgi:hypothetical protein